MEKSFSKTDVLNYLLGEESKVGSMVLLFEDSKKVRDFSNHLGEELRSKVSKFDGTKYRVRQNMLQVGERKIYLGLKQDEELLLNNYNEEQVKHFDLGEK